VSIRGGAAAAGRPVVSPIAFERVAGQSGATGGVGEALGSIPSACAARQSAPIPDAVVASVTSRRWCLLRRRRRRSRPRATRRALARLSTVGGWPIESASSRGVASRWVTRSRTRRSRGLRCSRWTSSRKPSRDTDLCWPAGASPDAESALVGASSWAELPPAPAADPSRHPGAALSRSAAERRSSSWRRTVVMSLDGASGRSGCVDTLPVSEHGALKGMGTGLHRSRWPPPAVGSCGCRGAAGEALLRLVRL
jgi:hypothetical protein